ncbi:MAG: Gfo/Idh/MocA family oxidoreductase [Actinomycetota bacterium]
MTDGGEQPIRYGVIGTGMMGVEHIQNVLALEGAVVTAVADPHPESQEWARIAVRTWFDQKPHQHALVGAENGKPVAPAPLAVFDDHVALLDSGLVDAVVIASPNFTHADVLLDVLEHPVHVLVEKPLCTTLADCRRVVDAAEATRERFPGRVVWMGLEYRYMPPIRRLLHEVAAGTVGSPRMVAIREHRFPFLIKVGDWNRFNRNTGGTLVEKCCHFFDLMLQVVDARPTRVIASGGQDVNHLDESYDGETPDILDNAYVIVEFDNGARAMLDLCMFAEASKNEREISVVGTDGKVEALDTESVVRIGRRTDDIVSGINIVTEEKVVDPGIRHVGLHHGASYLEHLDVAGAIRSAERTGRAEVPITLLDGLKSAAIGFAAHRSIDTGLPVTLDELTELDGIDW